MKNVIKTLAVGVLVVGGGILFWKSTNGARLVPSGAVVPAIETVSSASKPVAKLAEVQPPGEAGLESNSLRSAEVQKNDPVSGLVNAIKTAVVSLDPLEVARALHEFWPVLIARDRTSALALLEALESGTTREDFYRELAREWAVTDLAGAVGWAALLANQFERKIALQTACLQVGETNPAEAVAVWDSIRAGGRDPVLDDGGDLLLMNLVQDWAEKDFPASLAWASDRPVGERRDQAMARVAFVLAKTNPAQAASLITTQIGEGTAQTEVAVAVLHQWALHDFVGATAWVDRFPGSPLSARAKDELAGIARYLQSTPAVR